MFGGSPSLSLRLTHSAEIFKDLQQKAATKQTAKIQPFFYIHLHDLVHLINMSDVLQPLIHKSLFLQEKPETTKMKFFLNVKQNLLPFSFVFPFFLPFFLLLSADLEALLLLFLLPLCDQMLGRRRVFAAASSEEEKGFSFFYRCKNQRVSRTLGVTEVRRHLFLSEWKCRCEPAHTLHGQKIG